MIVTDPCAAPLQVLTTPELIQQGPSSLTAADDVTLAVENEFNANPGVFSPDNPLTIFGYSQSATAESIAMTQIHDYSMLHGDSIPLDDLHFVFIGDPSLEDAGIWPNLEHDLASLIGPEKDGQHSHESGFRPGPGQPDADRSVPGDDLYAGRRRVAEFQQASSQGVCWARSGICSSSTWSIWG